MKSRKKFGQLFDDAVHRISLMADRDLGVICGEIGDSILDGYSERTVQNWRKGKLPESESKVEAIAKGILDYLDNDDFGEMFDRAWRQDFIESLQHPETQRLIETLVGQDDAPTSLSIVIAYHQTQPRDSHLAGEIARELSVHHHVFFARSDEPDETWRALFQTKVDSADFVIFLLSTASDGSDPLDTEVRMVKDSRHNRSGIPAILPVWIGSAPNRMPKSAARLHKEYWARWRYSSDTPHLIGQLTRTIQGVQHLPNLKPFERVKSSPNMLRQPRELPSEIVPLGSPLYVPRDADAAFHKALARANFTLIVRGARQMGKSSLLRRGGQTVREQGRRFVELDLPRWDTSQHPDQYYRRFVYAFSSALDLPDKTAPLWADTFLTNEDRCTDYVRRHILKNFNTFATLVSIMGKIPSDQAFKLAIKKRLGIIGSLF